MKRLLVLVLVWGIIGTALEYVAARADSPEPVVIPMATPNGAQTRRLILKGLDDFQKQYGDTRPTRVLRCKDIHQGPHGSFICVADPKHLYADEPERPDE